MLASTCVSYSKAKCISSPLEDWPNLVTNRVKLIQLLEMTAFTWLCDWRLRNRVINSAYLFWLSKPLKSSNKILFFKNLSIWKWIVLNRWKKSIVCDIGTALWPIIGIWFTGVISVKLLKYDSVCLGCNCRRHVALYSCLLALKKTVTQLKKTDSRVHFKQDIG